MRGRGQRTRQSMGRGPSRNFVPHIPFDFVLCEQAFPRVKPTPNDDQLTQSLVKRNQELSAPAQDQTTIQSQVAKVTNALDSLVVMPPSEFEVQIEEYRQVGSFKKGTMMLGNTTADVAIILKTLPTKESIKKLGEKIASLVNTTVPGDKTQLVMTDAGFELKTSNVTVNILIATNRANMGNLDSELHIDHKLLQAALAAIRHARWFEENAFHSSVKMLVRLLKDMCKRFEGFSSLTPWIIDLLAHHAVINTPSRQPLPINEAFRRCLRLLASGFFLPGSAGIVDPCEMGNLRVHTVLSLTQQDTVCFTAQTLLRVLAHGGYKQIIGCDPPGAVDIANEISEWNGVVVTPSVKAYEKPPEREEPADEKMDTQEGSDLKNGS